MTPTANRLFLSQHAVSFAAAAAPATQPAATMAFQRLSPAMVDHILIAVRLPVPPPPSAPVANTQSGSVFEDRSNAALRWYLPGFLLADTPDGSFTFAAAQTGETDTNGDPFNKGTLKLRLNKTMQPDAAAFKAAHPAIELREIPVKISSAAIITTSRDPVSGQPIRSSYPGTAATGADGSLQLMFDNILGPAVIVLYENLIATGSAEIMLTGSCDVVFRHDQQQTPPSSPSPVRRLPPMMFRPAPVMVGNRAMMQERVMPIREQVEIPPRAAASPALPTFTEGSLPYSVNLSLGTRFAASAYQLKFTIAGPAGARPILNADDLKSFKLPQSEFAELKSLGDINARFPSLSRAYLGVVSRTIVVVPQRYVIIRDRDGCAAICLGLLDSSPSAASKCKFQFTFDVAPGASAVELLQLSQEIAGHPELKDYQIKFPDFLAAKPAATLSTSFESSFHYSAGAQPHVFSLSVELRDQDLNSPAVNNANLFLTALTTSRAPFLTGAIGLKLDDAFPDPVQSTVVLNFSATSGSDDLSFSVDEGSGTIQLLNRSPLDLALSRCALGVPLNTSVTALNQILAAGKTVAIPLPPNHTGLVFTVDAELAVPVPLSKTALARYLPISIQDVADTQFGISVNASGVDFTRRGIDQIRVQINFAAIPLLTPAPFSLNKLHTADGTVVLVPIQSAITELDGTAQFTVQFQDAQKPNLQFTKQNDFCSQALLVLQDSDLPA